MVFAVSDAIKYTGLANTPVRAKRWSRVANYVHAKTGDKCQAIRMANTSLFISLQYRAVCRGNKRQQLTQPALF